MGTFISYVFIEEHSGPDDDFITTMQRELILKTPSAATMKGGSFNVAQQRWTFRDNGKKNYLGNVLKHMVKSLKQ